MKTKKKRSGKGKEKNYPAYYLAAVLAGVLLLEGLLLGVATTQAWDEGLEILDLSSGVKVVMQDSATVMEPFMDQIAAVTEFYNIAAEETIVLLDSSEMDPMIFPRGVNEFYRLASVEMEKLLDFSDSFAYWPQVAGASISR